MAGRNTGLRLMLLLALPGCAVVNDERPGVLTDRHEPLRTYQDAPAMLGEPGYRPGLRTASPDLMAHAGRQIEPFSRPGVLDLVRQAEQAFDAGELSRSSSLYERALGIEPENGIIWYRLGKLRQAQGYPDQALALAGKARSRARYDERLQRWTWQLEAEALEALGQDRKAAEARRRAGAFDS